MIQVASQGIKKFVNAPLIFLIWLLYNSAYLALINVDIGIKAGYFALFGQVGLDLTIFVCTFLLYKKAHENNLKLAYLFFSLSALSAAIADFIYHAGMNILDETYFNLANSFFEVPFIFFLLFQAIAWGVVFFTNNADQNRKRYAYLPYLTVSLFIFFTFVYIVPWKIHYLSKLGIYQLIDTVLEAVGFSLAALCLTRSKDTPIRFLSVGYLLVISSDILIRYEVISGIIPSLNVFETTWILGLLLMTSGFIVASKSHSIKLLPLNSLQSYIAIWLLTLLLMFVGTFLFLNYFFPHTDVSHYLLWVIVPCTFFAILGSTYFASKILSPLARLEQIIKEFLNSENLDNPSIIRSPIHIEDFNLLEKFVYDSFDLYKKNHRIKIEYANMATQVAHDIQSPMLALNNYFREAVKLDIDKYEVVEASLFRINEIANNLLTQYKQPENNNDVKLVSALLQPLIDEKKLQYKDNLVEINLHIEKAAEFSSASLNTESFKRTLSNLINNAVESIKGKGQVNVTLKKDTNCLSLEIQDSGSGMPATILDNIKADRIEQSGTGLGLPYALKSIKKWGANYSIYSDKDKGTTFKIIFPLQNPPIEIQEDPDLVLIDDNKLVSEVWRIESKKSRKKLITFSDKNSFMKHSNQISKTTPIYLDLCLGNENGDEIAKELFDLGYKELYITTGYDITKINKSFWIKDILGKEPPFMTIEKEHNYE